MSSKQFLKYSLGTVLGIFVGYFGMSSMNTTSDKIELASASGFLPKQQLGKIGSDQFSRGYFNVEFEKVQVPTHDSDPVRIKAKLTALKDIPSELQFSWSLSPGVQSQMSISGTIPQLSAKSEHYIEIDVTGFSKSSRSFVSLSIYGELGSHKVARNIITGSKVEESYEYALHQQVIHKKNEQEQGSFIQSKLGMKKENKFDKKNVIR